MPAPRSVSPFVVLDAEGPDCGAGVTPGSSLRGIPQRPKAPRRSSEARPTASFHGLGVGARANRRPAAKLGVLAMTITRRKTAARNQGLRAIGASSSRGDLRIPPWDGRAVVLKEK